MVLVCSATFDVIAIVDDNISIYNDLSSYSYALLLKAAYSFYLI